MGAEEGKQDFAPLQQVPAVGFSLTANLFGERNVVFQTAFGSDELLKDPARCMELVTAVTGIVDKLKARYAMSEVETIIRQHEGMKAQQLRILEQGREELQTKLAERDQVAQAHLAEAAKLSETEAEAWKTSGRQGAYKAAPGGAAAVKKREAEKVRGEKTQLQAEFQKFEANVASTLKGFDSQIAEQKAELERLRSLSG